MRIAGGVMNPAAELFRGFIWEHRVGSGFTWIQCEHCEQAWRIRPLHQGLPQLLDELLAHRCRETLPDQMTSEG